MASSSSESQARTVCLTCGDKGDEGLLIYCINCQDSAAHFYCLDDFSSTDDQSGWKCWDCAPRIYKVDSFRKSERISMRIDRAIDVRMKLEKKLYSRSSLAGRKFVATNHGMVETPQLSGDSSSPVLCMKNSSDSNDGNIELRDYDRLKERFDKVEAESLPFTSNIHDSGFSSPKRINYGMTETAQLEDDSSTLIDRITNVHSFAELPRNEELRNRRRRRRLMIDDSCSSEEDNPINVKESSLAFQGYVEHVGPLNTSNGQLSSQPHRQLFARSLMNPIWRGSFSITREKNQTNLGILAHLSRKACSKVSDIAIMLPPELVAEVLAKRRVWPKSFQNVPPTDGSIDLFFFPEYERDEKVYDGLLDDMIEGDNALKVMMKDLELLIFSSRELPLEHWRFQQKYYLWGVFQKVHSSLPVNNSSNETITPSKQSNQSGHSSPSHNKPKPDPTFQICHRPSSTSGCPFPNTQYTAFLNTSRSSSEDSSISSTTISVAEKTASS
ncbi:unnamed protein product [Coffea canephora]|uniref:Zinc finger PHD-type domain-containing protein n=1 Tax=Coffea canephora TaxID=49390 RepID=A0A068U891_COFCA|nr:unnamed protein product [Coffea canephora]